MKTMVIVNLAMLDTESLTINALKIHLSLLIPYVPNLMKIIDVKDAPKALISVS